MKRLLLIFITICVIITFCGLKSIAQTVTISGFNKNLSTGVIGPNTSNYVVYGFELKVTGTVSLNKVLIAFSNGFSFNSGYISSALLYKSTSSGFTSPPDASVSTPGVQLQGSNFVVDFNNTPYTNIDNYYYIVLNFGAFTNGPPPSSFNACISSASNTAGNDCQNGNCTLSLQSGTGTLCGSTFTTVNPITYYWTGLGGNTSWTNKSNWTTDTNNPNAANTYPGTNAGDIASIGIADFRGKNNFGGAAFVLQPTLDASQSIYQLKIGNLKALTLSTNSNTLTVTNGMSVGSSTSNPAAINAATTSSASTLTLGSASTISSGAVLTMGSTTITTLSTGATLVNSGTYTLSSDINGTAAIAALPSGASITGNTTVQRYFTGGNFSNRGWRLLSSPITSTTNTTLSTTSKFDFSSLQSSMLITGTGGNAKGFDPTSAEAATILSTSGSTYTANGPTVLFYDEPTSKFTLLASISTLTSPATGFYFYFRGDKTTNLAKKLIKPAASNYATPEANVKGTWTGYLNQGSLSFPITKTSASTTGFNLLGNPYPSTITLTSTSIPTPTTTGFIYLYNSTNNSCGAYSLPQNIASGQAFFVKATTNGNINFTESMKTSGALTAGLLMGIPVTSQEANINLKMIQDSANIDMAQLRFMDSYTKDYNEYEDADDLSGSGQTVFFGAMTADNHEVAIASQPMDKTKTSVFLSVDNSASGQYSIQKSSLTGIPKLYDVWLIDHFKNDSLDLRNNDIYTFNLDKTNAATFGNKRFEVIIRKQSLPPYALVSFTGARLNKDNVLKWSTSNEFDYTTFEIQKSTDGTTFAPIGYVYSNSKGNYTFTDLGSSGNVYYKLKQTDVNDKVTYSDKVFINEAVLTFSIFPNPTSNIINFAINRTIQSSLYSNIYNSTGNLIKTAIFTTPSGQQDISSLPIGSYTFELLDNSKKLLGSAKFIKL